MWALRSPGPTGPGQDPRGISGNLLPVHLGGVPDVDRESPRHEHGRDVHAGCPPDRVGQLRIGRCQIGPSTGSGGQPTGPASATCRGRVRRHDHGDNHLRSGRPNPDHRGGTDAVEPLDALLDADRRHHTVGGSDDVWQAALDP